MSKQFLHRKKLLGFKRPNSRELSLMGILLALTAIMSVFLTFRIGEVIKIPTKFLPIAMAAMFFGPLWGGIIGALADLLAYAISPVAVFMPQITFVEFLYGFSYGIFLKHITPSPKGYLLSGGCVIFQIIFLHILLTSYFLMPIMNIGYKALIITRMPAALLNTILQLTGIFFLTKYSCHFKKLFNGGLK